MKFVFVLFLFDSPACGRAHARSTQKVQSAGGVKPCETLLSFQLEGNTMRTNWEIALRGKLVELVPYRREHVPTYHEWMKDPWIREMTASEPLTLEEEYAMQISWRDDPKKCTFIIMGRGEGDKETTMAGDVNLFFNDFEDPGVCEVEVMIAEERWRRRGLAQEAVLMMMRYALDYLGATMFYCKIGDDNKASRALFEKLGFCPHAYVKAFKETELRFETAVGGGADRVRVQTAHVETVRCPPPSAEGLN